jgi:hypothetical protein
MEEETSAVVIAKLLAMKKINKNEWTAEYINVNVNASA